MAQKERISLSNKACLGAGVNPIESFEDGTAESIFLKEWYELTVEAELSLYKWRFATKTVNLRNSLLNQVPDTRYNTAYQIPNDVLSVDTVLVNDVPINYDRHQKEIHTHDSSDDDVIIKYRFRADESLWNPYFTLLVVYRLATMLSFSIARKEDIATVMKGLADEHWRKAKTEDAQGQTNRGVNLSRLKRARGGRIDKFWRRR